MQDPENVQDLQSQLSNAMKLIAELQRGKSSNSLGESESPATTTKPTPDHPKATPKAKVAATPKVSAAKAKPAAKSTPSPTPPPAASGDGEKALLALGFFHLNCKFGNVFQSKRVSEKIAFSSKRKRLMYVKLPPCLP